VNPHREQEDKKQWAGETQKSYPFCSIKLAHGSPQSLSDQVHRRYQQQGHEECEEQPVDQSPGQWPPENYTIASHENMWLQMLEKRHPINI